MKRTIQLIFIFLYGTFQLNAQIAKEVIGIQYYITSANTVSVNKYTGIDLKVIIPESVFIDGNFYKVTKIEESAFHGCKSVVGIVVPNSVKTIGFRAFEDCISLTNISIPNSVTEIESNAFLNCSSLRYITLPNSLREIRGLFFGCRDLENIIIPNTIVNIDNSSFYGCKSLKKIIIPPLVSEISDYTFNDCSSLTELLIPESIKSIGWHAFNGCSSLTKLSIPENVIIKSTSFLFDDCCSLKSVNLPKSVKNIEKYCFYNCRSLKEIIIPDSVRTIEEKAFYGCRSLKKITVPNTVDSIDRDAFSSCESLEEIILPDKKPNYISSFDLFSNDKKIANVRGHKTLLPYYVTADFFDKDAPVQKKIAPILSSFSFYAAPKLEEKVAEWQKRKEYESTDQWKVRVTEESRSQLVSQEIMVLQNKYISERTAKPDNYSLLNYDADYSVFIIKTDGFDSFGIQVPVSEAPGFREKWNNGKVKILPQYGIINDQLAIISCTCQIGRNKYQSVQKQADNISSNLALNLPPLKIDLTGNTGKSAESSSSVIDNAVDINIPSTTAINSKTFAVVIGNENYQRAAKVAYAVNDAKVFAGYCQKTLGLPASNVRLYKDATYGSMLAAVKDIQSIADAYHGEINVIFYYAGHGIPAENTKEAYLLPEIGRAHV